jgi:hypothetical protein
VTQTCCCASVLFNSFFLASRLCSWSGISQRISSVTTAAHFILAEAGVNSGVDSGVNSAWRKSRAAWRKKPGGVKKARGGVKKTPGWREEKSPLNVKGNFPTAFFTPPRRFLHAPRVFFHASSVSNFLPPNPQARSPGLGPKSCPENCGKSRFLTPSPPPCPPELRRASRRNGMLHCLHGFQ